ncbi:twin-arginine translocase TatA/TatE family subunit [Demequina sp. NBRC 110055]|uniref:twin-arginine translocase TatA/TatE family subunit n=1 Tax=Demequina sp. NBRC 110055 TaxID=1570344 RepID=UPI000A054BAF|nr:twin-arginine translocase TatA/TatE family subunit [Demequina sp. NBRC 110055]
MGAREWIIIAVIVLLLFGAPKLPELARSIGKSLNILKDETANLRSDKNATGKQDAPAADGTGTAQGAPAPRDTTTPAAAPEAPQQSQIPDSTVDLPSDDQGRGN